MHSENLTEALSAAHLSHYVQGQTSDRGGVMLVAPAGSLKTTITEITDAYGKTLLLSDLTIRQASTLRSDMICNKIVTLAFSDFAKLYARNPMIASNIEGFLRAAVAEGVRNVNWEPPRAVALPARCLIIGSMTDQFYKQRVQQWDEDGISRRFLWCHYRLCDEANLQVTDALRQGKRLFIGAVNGFDAHVPTEMLRENVTDQESHRLLSFLQDQPDDKIPMVLLRKMLTALKWKFRLEKKKPMRILEDFAQSLRKNGCDLILPKEKR